jgi:hypothetical protein
LTEIKMQWTRVKWSEAGQITALLSSRPAGEGDGLAPAEYFAGLLAAARYDGAVRFLALALPRFETVAWAARIVRDMARPAAPDQPETLALKSALLWLQDPVEGRRRSAFDAASAARPNSPEAMAAMAVFYSGGSVAPPDCQPLPAPREAAGRFAAGAILLAAARDPDMSGALRRALALGETLAEGVEVP